MPRRLSKAIALWFVVQIVVPFTAPLQTLDLRDWFGARAHPSALAAPESSTTPTIKEDAAAGALAPLVQRPAPIGAWFADARAIDRASLAPVHPPPHASSRQRSVLRL